MEISEKIIFESQTAKVPFVVRSVPSIILRIGYFLFSIHWMYRFFRIKASYIFLLIGFFFLLSSLYFLLFPLFVISTKKTMYFLTKNKFYYIGPLGRHNSINISQIKEFRLKKSFFDKKSDTASFELTYCSKDIEKVEDYIDIYGVENFQDLNNYLEKIVSEHHKYLKKNNNTEKRESSNMLKKYNPIIAILKHHYKKIVFIIVALAIIGGIVNLFRSSEITGRVVSSDASSDIINSGAFLYAELNESIKEKNIRIGVQDELGGSCCSEDYENKLSIRYSFWGSPQERPNLTIYLFNKDGNKKLEKLTKKYIKKVYICLPEGFKASKDFIKYFGEEKVTKETCKKFWIDGNCCDEWAMPIT